MIMSPRKRSSKGDSEAQELPLRGKRRRTSAAEDDEHDLEDSLSHMAESIAKRGLRSNAAADVPIRLGDSGSPEVAKLQPSKKKSHVKFRSESPPPVPQEEQEQRVQDLQHDVEEEDEDSDDEAPEAISHSTAQAATKAAQAEEARLLKQRERDEREKRRKRDADLKAQVQKSEKRRRRVEEEDDEVAVKKSKKSNVFDMENLPDFLPEELLATEAPARMPTPPPVADGASRVKKLTGNGKIRRKWEEKAPKDVVSETTGTKIRVLPTTNKTLPPKINSSSKGNKAQWMQGRAAFQQANKRGDSIAKLKRRAGPVAFA